MSGIRGISSVFDPCQREIFKQVEEKAPLHLKFKQRAVLRKAVKAKSKFDQGELFLTQVENRAVELAKNLRHLHLLVTNLYEDYEKACEATKKVTGISLSVIKKDENNIKPDSTDNLEIPFHVHNEADNPTTSALAIAEAEHALKKLAKGLNSTCKMAKKLSIAEQQDFDQNVYQYRLYAFVSDRLKKPFDKLTEEDIQALQGDYDLQMAHIIDQEFAEESHEQKLENCSSRKSYQQLTSAQRKKKKYREKKKAAAALAKNALIKTQTASKVADDKLSALGVVEKNPEQAFLQELNQISTSKKFKEDQRCVSWRKKCDYTKIQDIEGNFTYRDKTSEQMVFIAQQHRLDGANQLLSNKEAIRRYGMKYVWYNVKGVRQRGFRFPAVMITPTQTYAGTVQLAYDSSSKVIFHERFLPFGMEKKILKIKDLTSPMEAPVVLEEKFGEEGNEQPWTNVSPVTFKSGENGSLIWEIGEEEANRVTIILNRIRL